MNIYDILILTLVAIPVILAFLSLRKKGCSSSCGCCPYGENCTKKTRL